MNEQAELRKEELRASFDSLGTIGMSEHFFRSGFSIGVLFQQIMTEKSECAEECLCSECRGQFEGYRLAVYAGMNSETH
jgi:hypothetical protein